MYGMFKLNASKFEIRIESVPLVCFNLIFAHVFQKDETDDVKMDIQK